MRKTKKLIALAMSVLFAGSLLGACKDDTDPLAKGKTVVEYWRSSAMEQAIAVQNAVNWYNENNTDNVYI